MPRTYKPKSNRVNITHDVMKIAVNRVNQGESTRKVATDMDNKKSNLFKYVNVYKNNPNERLEPNYCKSQVFIIDQETTFVDYLDQASKMFYGLTPYMTTENLHTRWIRRILYVCLTTGRKIN